MGSASSFRHGGHAPHRHPGSGCLTGQFALALMMTMPLSNTCPNLMFDPTRASLIRRSATMDAHLQNESMFSVLPPQAAL